MKQGEIWEARLDPAMGKEQRGKRPVLVISGNAMNENSGLCIICPLSTRIKSFPGCVVLTKSAESGLKTDSLVLTFQIRVVSSERLDRKLGCISRGQLLKVIAGLNDILTY